MRAPFSISHDARSPGRAITLLALVTMVATVAPAFSASATAYAMQSTQASTPPAKSTVPPTKAAASTPTKQHTTTPPSKQQAGTSQTPPKRGATPPSAATKAGASQAKTGAKPTTSAAQPIADANKPMVIMRESFGYASDGRRDPFLSLLTTSDLRPTVSDLKLLGILVDPPNGSMARVHDSNLNKTYTIRINQQLGRMRVVDIRMNAVIFSVDEFGASRRDSLLLRPDSSKMRFE